MDLINILRAPFFLLISRPQAHLLGCFYYCKCVLPRTDQPIDIATDVNMHDWGLLWFIVSEHMQWVILLSIEIQ